MNKLITPEIPINVFSRYISYLVFSSPLSSLPLFEFPDTMPQIEEEIENNIDEKNLDEEDGEIEIDNKIRNISVYK